MGFRKSCYLYRLIKMNYSNYYFKFLLFCLFILLFSFHTIGQNQKLESLKKVFNGKKANFVLEKQKDEIDDVLSSGIRWGA
jgi:hypothetical protein